LLQCQAWRRELQAEPMRRPEQCLVLLRLALVSPLDELPQAQ
jgi:hypothetical protein